ncbi:MAG: hypothetical protein IKC03_07505 [Oscillospiraceae bacterium]|nr:hypothetical protein [Oscillospiraceae bacterium]
MTERKVCETTEEKKLLLSLNEKGQPRNTMQNVYTVLTCDPTLRGTIRHNILTGRTDICKPLWWERSVSAMNDTDFNYIMLYLENRYGLDNENKIRRALSVVAHQNQYHPIRDYLNALDFLPLDRSGNRRFLPVMVHPEQAEVHILEDEQASRQYINQLWAEAMTIYRNHPVQLKLSNEMNAELVKMQKQFMPEDTKVGMIQSFLDDFDGNMVCSKLLFHEALGRFDEPKMWEIREINDIMNQSVTGWTPYPNPRNFKKYGKQRGWIRGNEKMETDATSVGEFRELTEEECSQTEIPF